MLRSKDKRYIFFLYTGFGILVVSFIVLAFLHFKLIVDANDDLRHATNNNDNQLEYALSMRVAIRERAILLWHMTFTDDVLIRDELFEQFKLFGAQYETARFDYLSSHLTIEERSMLDEIDEKNRTIAPETDKFAGELMDRVAQDSIYVKLDRVLSNQVLISEVIDRIIQYQQEQNRQERLYSGQKTEDVLEQLIVWLLVFVSIVAVFAQTVVRVANQQGQRLARANSELSQLARIDPLTGLPNRRFLIEHLGLSLARAKRYDQHGAILFIDLDDFKPINDEYGHDIGDAYLVAVGNEVNSLLRESDILARLGGDEFVVMLSEIQDEVEAAVVTRKIIERISRPFEINGISLSTSASIGICHYPQGEMDVEELLRNADRAMYLAKRSGKNRFKVFAPYEHGV